MKDETRSIFSCSFSNNSRVKIFGVGLVEASRLPHGQIPLHGEICFRQKQGVFVGFSFRSAHSAKKQGGR